MGLFTLIGQISVVGISVMGWSYAQTGSYTLSMVVIAAMLAISVLIVTRLRESEYIQQVNKN